MKLVKLMDDWPTARQYANVRRRKWRSAGNWRQVYAGLLTNYRLRADRLTRENYQAWAVYTVT